MTGRRGPPRPADPSRPGPSARDRALRLLTRREYSRTELTTRLTQWGHPSEEIEKVLDTLASTGLQSDERYTASQIRARAAREGNRSLRQRLGRQGIDEEMVNEALTQLPREGDRLAHLLARDKKGLDDPVHRRRVIARCLRRGFSWDEIRQALRAVSTGELPEVDPDALGL